MIITYSLIGLSKTIEKISLTLKSEGNHIQAMEFLTRLDRFLFKKPEIWMFMPSFLENGKWIPYAKTPDQYDDFVKRSGNDYHDEQLIKYRLDYDLAKDKCLFHDFIINTSGNYVIFLSNIQSVSFPFIYDTVGGEFLSTPTLAYMCDFGFILSNEAVKELKPIPEYGEPLMFNPAKEQES
jgi:hypothetical protein